MGPSDFIERHKISQNSFDFHDFCSHLNKKKSCLNARRALTRLSTVFSLPWFSSTRSQQQQKKLSTLFLGFHQHALNNNNKITIFSLPWVSYARSSDFSRLQTYPTLCCYLWLSCSCEGWTLHSNHMSCLDLIAPCVSYAYTTLNCLFLSVVVVQLRGTDASFKPHVLP
jgi:hypothetical protein